MRDFFDKLYRQSKYKRVFPCVDTSITFLSCREGLIDQFTSLLQCFLPMPETLSKKDITCVVAQTTDIDDWPESLFKKAKEISEIDDMAAGQATMLSSDCGMTLIMKPTGSIYHSGDGHFLCLTPPPDRDLKEGETQDVLGLATVLLSETLLFTDKLLVHGGAVGNGESSQVWTGDSGAGKTTQILKLVAQGWDFYGEDQIILGKDTDGRWMVWPFWRQINATAETTRLLPTHQNLSKQSPNSRNKYSFENIEEVLQVTKPAALPLSSIYKVIPGHNSIHEELDFNKAFQHISSGFMHSLSPNATVKVVDILLDMVSEIPVYLVSWDMLEDIEADKTIT